MLNSYFINSQWNQDSRVKNEILLQEFSRELFYNTGLFYDLNLEATEGKIDRFNFIKKKILHGKTHVMHINIIQVLKCLYYVLKSGHAIF